MAKEMDRGAGAWDEDRAALEQLTACNNMVRDVALPGDLMPAFASGRAGLLGFWAPRAMGPDEAKLVVDALRALLDTNRALQDHARLVERRLDDLLGSLKGAVGTACRARDLAAFRQEITEGIEDEA